MDSIDLQQLGTILSGVTLHSIAIQSTLTHYSVISDVTIQNLEPTSLASQEVDVAPRLIRRHIGQQPSSLPPLV